MIEEDTIKLLRECDQGIKMGISSIDQVISYVSSEKMKNVFLKSKMEHSKIENEIEEMLSRFQDEGKNPNIFVQGMSKMKTNIELMINDSDYKIASIMVDGTNMGVKSLSRYLNQYKAASEEAKYITRKIIKLEEKLSKDLREFL
ncbi:MAG: hypothetical protein E7177_04625 [Erysipelotrichaceae bacterium]|nr:hypothetical protein [Erysipelotrichaceae bacterium]